MRTRTLLAAVMAATIATSPALAKRDRKDEAAALVPVPGAKAESCIPLNAIRETRVRDDRTIDFYSYGGRIYRNTLPNACPRLGAERAFSYATSLSRLCSVDIITVISQSGGPGFFAGPSCGLGEFQPVRKAP